MSINYVQSQKLSSSECAAILNTNTPEELWNLKNTITSKIVEQEDIGNNNYPTIRILSRNEYKKYVLEGSANGSITPNAANVWHYCDFPHTTFSANSTSLSLKILSDYQLQCYSTSGATYYASNDHGYINMYFYTTLIADNTADNTFAYFPESKEYNLLAWKNTGSNSAVQNVSLNGAAPKTTANYLRNQIDVYAWSNNYGHFYFNYTFSFRPVFTINDVKKEAS